MATSGSWDYSLTAANVIDMALENIGVLAAGATVASADQTLALRRLNVIVKQFQGTADGMQGMKVWTRQTVTLFLAKGQQSYEIGPAAADARATTQYGRTTLSGAEASGQTVLSITSNTDTTTYPGTTVTMTSGDFIGVVLDDGTIHWSTISGTPSTTATINAALPSDAAAGNYVYWFTSRAQRFPAWESAWIRSKNLDDTQLVVFRNSNEYNLGVASKYSDGDPTSVLIEPKRLTTRVTFDSQPTDVTDQVFFSVLYPAEDYDATTNDIAFPQEWLLPLSWKLSKEIAPAFGAIWTPTMEENFQSAMAIARNMNPEVSDLYFQPGE